MKHLFLLLLAMSIAHQSHAGNVQLGLELKGLEHMKGQHYEGWNIINGKAISTGRFSIERDASIYQVNSYGELQNKVGSNGVASFTVSRKHLKATLFVLTIEPNNDKDDGPSQVHVIGGNYSQREAKLSVDHRSSLGTDFASAEGEFILAAPTGGAFNKGVWFFDPATAKGALDLPELPEGWAYEGWIVNKKNGRKFSTGLFKDTNSADSDGAGFLAGPLKLSFPKVPGQDIVKSRVVIDDGIHTIVVSVEPYPDYDPAPYAIKVLKANVSSGAPGMTKLPLTNISRGIPSGLAHIH